MPSDLTKLVGSAVLLAVILAGSIWFRVAAPCSTWAYAPVKDVPARCVAWVHH